MEDIPAFIDCLNISQILALSLVQGCLLAESLDEKLIAIIFIFQNRISGIVLCRLCILMLGSGFCFLRFPQSIQSL